jgi:hypothetical protein
MRARLLLLLVSVVCLARAQPGSAQSPQPAPPAPDAAAEAAEDAHASDSHDEHDLHNPADTPIAQGYVGDAWADEDTPLTLGIFSFRVLLQTRYEHSYPATSEQTQPGLALREDVLARDGDGLSVQRFFLRIAANPLDYVSFKSILDLSKLRGNDVSNVLKQAFMQISPVPKRLELVAGVFKLPYSILELDPVARFELPNLGRADDLVKNLNFAGRDTGLMVMVAPLSRPKWLRFQLGIFRGRAKDEHSSPIGAIGGRLESKPIKGLRLGFDVVGMPVAKNYKRPFETSSDDVLPDAPDRMYPREQRWDRGVGYSADVSYTRKYFSVRAEGMLGDRVDIDTRYGARSFWSVWGLVAYRFKLGPLGIMPAARVEWLDTDREHDGGGQLELSAALNVLYKRRVRWLLAVTRIDVQRDTPVLEQPRPLPYIPYFALDITRVTLQLQLEI